MNGRLAQHIVQERRGETAMHDADVTVERVAERHERGHSRAALLGPVPQGYRLDALVTSKRLPEEVCVGAVAHKPFDALLRLVIAS